MRSVAQPPISTDPNVMHGTPCFTGTRVPVTNLFDLLAHGRTIEYFLEQFPAVRREQVLAVLRLADEKLTGHAA
jgi:uncharacterized protein (DUF433 family)